MTERPLYVWARRVTTLVVLGVVWFFLASYFKPSLLFRDTMIGGGDTPSFLRPVHHLRDTLLPAGQPQGYDLGNFAGYAPYQFYFLPPSLIIVALAKVVPFNVAFKLVTAAGSFLLPLTTLLALAAMGYAFPVPAVGAAATLIFLFNEGNSMWGGNIPSTLAGEFSHSMGFAFAVLFLGLLHRGVARGRGWKLPAAVLAMAGLCHPVAFLNAATPGAFFLLDRRRFPRNLRYIATVYGAAVLLMGFWLFPLMAKIGYATSINWKWVFDSWRVLLPKVFWPVLALALADVIWLAFSRQETDRRGRYLLFGLVATVVTFFNATSLGLPDVRFVPFVYFLALLLALDLLAKVLVHVPGRHVGALALSAGILAWVQMNISFIPSWIEWNYSGLETKPSWGLLRAITDSVRGKIDDPRVAYENSPLHERFGSMRVFEDLPLLAGRATLEGVLLQTSVESPYVYWIQSLVSKQGTGVIPGYNYPYLELARGTARLKLFNVSDLITVTPEVQGPLDKDARWQRILTKPPYVVYHLKDADPHYVRVPRFRPVLVETKQWKRDFHRWFATDSALDVPIVAASMVPASERGRFPITSDSPSVVPHVPARGGCEIEEHVSHLAIDFTTSCPGEPHVVAVSYYPNWHVEGASRVFMASPAFMLVFPDGPHVRLTFGRVGADWVGIAVSLAGLALCLVAAWRPRPREGFAPAVDRGLAVVHPWAVSVVVVVALLATLWSALADQGMTRWYQTGWKAFEKQDYPTSLDYFGRVMLLGKGTRLLGGNLNVAGDATFFHAASLLRQNEPAEAMRGYQEIIDDFPASIWVAESHYHVGLCLRQLGRIKAAKAKFRYVTTTYPGNPWAKYAAEQMKTLHQEAHRHG